MNELSRYQVPALGEEPQALQRPIAQIQTQRESTGQRPVPIRPLKRDDGVRPLKRGNGETRLAAEARDESTAQSIPSPIQLLRYLIGPLNDISPAATQHQVHHGRKSLFHGVGPPLENSKLPMPPLYCALTST